MDSTGTLVDLSRGLPMPSSGFMVPQSAGTERDSVSGQQLSAVLACENVPRLALEDQSPLPRQRRGTIVEIDRQNGS